VQKITKILSPDFHNEQNQPHKQFLWQISGRHADILLLLHGLITAECVSNSTYIFIEMGRRQLPCEQGTLQPLSRHALYKTMLA